MLGCGYDCLKAIGIRTHQNLAGWYCRISPVVPIYPGSLILKVGFVLINELWLGGVHYLLNLISALSELPDHPLQPILFVGPEVSDTTLEKFRPFLEEAPLRCDDIMVQEAKLPLLTFIRQRAEGFEKTLRTHRVDVLFHTPELLMGSRFGIPTLGWAPDVQHRLLPGMFGPVRYLRRELSFQLLIDESTRIMLSSECARKDVEMGFRRAQGRLDAVPFAIQTRPPSTLPNLSTLRLKYDLPRRFFFLPNQFWRHKNHVTVIKALQIANASPIIVSTGSLNDPRDPGYSKILQTLVQDLGVGDRFRILGQVPYEDVLGLLVNAQALLNPSLFEGWSTTVEEAKAYGIPMILSDLPVHREQAGVRAKFFSPDAPESLANLLCNAWEETPLLHRTEVALEAYPSSRMRFGESFLNLVRQCENRD